MNPHGENPRSKKSQTDTENSVTKKNELSNDSSLDEQRDGSAKKERRRKADESKSNPHGDNPRKSKKDHTSKKPHTSENPRKQVKDTENFKVNVQSDQPEDKASLNPHKENPRKKKIDNHSSELVQSDGDDPKYQRRSKDYKDKRRSLSGSDKTKRKNNKRNHNSSNEESKEYSIEDTSSQNSSVSSLHDADSDENKSRKEGPSKISSSKKSHSERNKIRKVHESGKKRKPGNDKKRRKKHDSKNMTTPVEENKVIERRNRVEEEIIGTEELYRDNLSILITIFRNPIREKELLTPEDMKKVFQNIDIVYSFSGTMASTLAEVRTNPELTIGEVFTRYGPFLKCYTDYCTNYVSSVEYLSNLETKNKKLKAFLTEAAKAPEVRGLSLKDFLIQPVQRICKYPLLFRELLSSIEENDPEHDKIMEAFNFTQDLAHHVNQDRDKYEKFNKLVHYMDNISDYKKDLYHDGRSFIFDAVVQKGSGEIGENIKKNFLERKLVLFNNLIMYLRIIKPNSSYQFKGEIPIDDSVTLGDLDPDYPSKNLTARLDSITHNKTFYFRFENTGERNNFVKHFLEQKEEYVRPKNTGLGEMAIHMIDLDFKSNFGSISKKTGSNITSPKTKLQSGRKSKSDSIEGKTKDELIDLVRDLKAKLVYQKTENSKSVKTLQATLEEKNSEIERLNVQVTSFERKVEKLDNSN